MQRKQDGLVPIGEVLADLPGPVKAIRDATPQAVHHFTRFDQVNQLVSASEADPDLGFMARLLALCSLPRTNPGTRKEYKRVNGPFTLYMTAIGDNKLPFGKRPSCSTACFTTRATSTSKSTTRGYDSNGAKSNAKGCRLVPLAVSVRLRGGPRPSRSGTCRRG